MPFQHTPEHVSTAPITVDTKHISNGPSAMEMQLPARSLSSRERHKLQQQILRKDCAMVNLRRMYPLDLPTILQEVGHKKKPRFRASLETFIQRSFCSYDTLSKMEKECHASQEEIAAMHAFKNELIGYVYWNQQVRLDSDAGRFLVMIHKTNLSLVGIDVPITDTYGDFGTTMDMVFINKECTQFYTGEFFSLRHACVFLHTPARVPTGTAIEMEGSDVSAIPAFCDRAVVISQLASNWFYSRLWSQLEEIQGTRNMHPFRLSRVGSIMVRWMHKDIDQRVNARRLAREDVATAHEQRREEIENRDILIVRARCLWYILRKYVKVNAAMRIILEELRERNRLISLTHLDGAPSATDHEDVLAPMGLEQKLRLAQSDPNWGRAVVSRELGKLEHRLYTKRFRESEAWIEDEWYPGPKHKRARAIDAGQSE